MFFSPRRGGGGSKERGGLFIIQNKTYYKNWTMLWDFFERINISILLTSKAHKDIFT